MYDYESVTHIGLYCSTLPLNIDTPIKLDSCCIHSMDVTCNSIE